MLPLLLVLASASGLPVSVAPMHSVHLWLAEVLLQNEEKETILFSKIAFQLNGETYLCLAGSVAGDMVVDRAMEWLALLRARLGVVVR